MNPERSPEEIRRAKKVFAAYFFVLLVIFTVFGAVWLTGWLFSILADPAGEVGENHVLFIVIGLPLHIMPVLLSGWLSFILWGYLRR